MKCCFKGQAKFEGTEEEEEEEEEEGDKERINLEKMKISERSVDDDADRAFLLEDSNKEPSGCNSRKVMDSTTILSDNLCEVEINLSQKDIISKKFENSTSDPSNHNVKSLNCI